MSDAAVDPLDLPAAFFENLTGRGWEFAVASGKSLKISNLADSDKPRGINTLAVSR